jgi:hypothetical protein
MVAGGCLVLWSVGCGGASAPASDVAPEPVTIELGAPSAREPVSPSPPPRLAVAAGSPLLGRWTGTGEQTSGDQWPMEVEVTSVDPGVCATVDYPSLGCSGEWRCTQASSEDVLDALEQITVDPRHQCVPTGHMTMRLRGSRDYAMWRWDGGRESARALLRRAE